MARNANNYPPGLLEQYKISLQRLKTGVGAEFVSFPGCNSQPSRFTGKYALVCAQLTQFRCRPS